MSPALPEPLHDQPCPMCGRAGSMSLGQSAFDDRLHWYQSINCGHCGRQEADERGLPPEPVRELLMVKGGRWIVMACAGSDSLAIAKVLRAAMGQSLSEAIGVLKRLPRIYRGTRVECTWLQGLLKAEGVDAVMERDDCEK